MIVRVASKNLKRQRRFKRQGRLYGNRADQSDESRTCVAWLRCGYASSCRPPSCQAFLACYIRDLKQTQCRLQQERHLKM